MGRTNGKLINFLKSGLWNSTYENLQFGSEDFDIFTVELPRYLKNKDLHKYEKILKEWYQCNGKIHLYKSYTNAKAVFQAALKKSIYLKSLGKVERKLIYQFSSKEEAEAKRLKLKEKFQELHPNLSSVFPCPSPSEASSGYHSGNESGSEDSPIPDDRNMEENFLADLLEDPFKYLSDKYVGLSNNLFDNLMDQTESLDVHGCFGDLPKPLMNLTQETNPQKSEIECELQPLAGKVEHKSQPVMCSVECESLSLPVQVQPESKSILELKPIPVTNSNVSKKTFWRCKQKIIFDETTLLLKCDREVVEDDNNTINEGQIFIPNEVWEPGVSYQLLKCVEVCEKNFVFFSQKYSV